MGIPVWDPNSDPQTLKSVKINSSKNRQITVHALVPHGALSILFCFLYAQLKFASHKHYFLFQFAFIMHATHVSYMHLFT